jgi:hypothetical protein
LILLWLISRVSSRGIRVNLVLVRPKSPPKKCKVHTTSGNVEKELCLRFRYLSRERYINSSGKAVSWLLPRASLYSVRNCTFFRSKELPFHNRIRFLTLKVFGIGELQCFGRPNIRYVQFGEKKSSAAIRRAIECVQDMG